MAMVEQQYLGLREKLKEAYRKKRLLENGNEVISVRNDDYGSFFGPSVTILAKGLNRETNTSFQKLSSKPSYTMNKKEKVEKIKEARDYSFLFSDAPNLDSGKRVSVDQSKGSAKQQTSKNQTKPKGFPSKTTLPNVENNEKVQQREKTESESKSKQFNLKIRLKVPPKSVEVEKQPSSYEDSKKRPLRERYSGSEGEKALSMVRRMFNTQRFEGRDDSDKVMEATFGDIVKEEKRSERVGRKEDQQQLRLIQQEENRRHMAKRHRH